MELLPGATDAERAAARAEAAAGVEHAANEMGGHWAEAYQELHPDWQPSWGASAVREGGAWYLDKVSSKMKNV